MIVKMSKKLIGFLTALLMVMMSLGAFASEGGEHGEEKAFNPGEMIMHHVSDAHSIHIGTFTIPLPVILYTDKGIDVFMSSAFDENGEYTSPSTGNTYVNHHEVIELKGAHHEADDHATENHNEDKEAHTLIDFSITKSVFGMLFIMLMLFLLFRSVAKTYKKREGMAPTGKQNLLEALILFIRDEVAIPSIGKKHAGKFMPLLLSIFFFIWMANMFGLIPFLGFNITGTLSVTLVMAAIIFIVVTINGNKHYWGHILNPPGVPLPIKFILVPIEFASIFIKPIVLMVRLTANIVAGHIIILSFVSLILIFASKGIAAEMGVGLGSVAFMVFMFVIELLVAFLQAYVFTLLAALYLGDAKQEPHH